MACSHPELMQSADGWMVCVPCELKLGRWYHSAVPLKDRVLPKGRIVEFPDVTGILDHDGVLHVRSPFPMPEEWKQSF